MDEIELLASTGEPLADRVAQGVVGVFEIAFAGRVRGYYLRGSRASGTAVAGSDLDLYVLFADRFADREQARRARALADHCAKLSPILLEIVVVSQPRVQEPDALSTALDLRLATRLLYGEDIRAGLPEFRASDYVRSVVHAPYYSYRYPTQRQRLPALTYPLAHIDPAGEFYGYDQLAVPGPDGAQVPSTKLLTASVTWTATALVALRSGQYVRDKPAAVALYREHVGDEWTELVTAVYQQCREQWHYLVPQRPDQRAQLRALCDQALAFQNHFLRRYREYLLVELDCGEPARQLLAVQRLAEIRFSDREVVAGLRCLHSDGSPEVRQAVELTLAGYPPPR